MTPSGVAEKLSFISVDEIGEIVKEFVDRYRPEDSKQEWFEKLKVIARNHNFGEVSDQDFVMKYMKARTSC